MEYVEVYSDEEFDGLHLLDDVEIFNVLVDSYPDESAEALGDFVSIEEDLNGLSLNYLKFFFEIYDYGDLVEWIDDYIDEEVLVNYYVRDVCQTDVGVCDLIVSNGYMLKQYRL